ncbi:uncharacterized protein B0T15DRAFT_146050 [Chaetomium strumarium]|uniref:Histone deacetylase complex subunit SAP30 Sin3 binding domain-containing protein n=1 Tax=Chaetomium strumarium TaxID=1170767 RepID=A0AAJ0M2G0_9PEZI|nr:hypothetical protein B0T15DRAFT_146050 [Chaetomium strumarium]
MAPSKAARSGQDDPKADNASAKEKNGSSTGAQAGTKMRRVASNAGSNLREVTNASAVNATATADSTANAPEANTPGVSIPQFFPSPIRSCVIHLLTLSPFKQLQWPAFDRDVLHAYRRAYRLKTPTAFVSDHHEWVLTQPGSIGLYSPTIARRKEFRRQTKDQLTNVVRKHFNGLGVQENDIIVDFLHKVRSQNISKARLRRSTDVHQEPER